MLHKKTIYLLLIITSLLGTYQATQCMDDLLLRKTQAKINLLEKQKEAQEAKKDHLDDLYAAKKTNQTKQTEKLQADIDHMGAHHRVLDGAIGGLKDGIAGGISGSSQYYMKKKIDLYLDGNLTVAELLAELHAREDYLTKKIQSIQVTSQAKAPFIPSEKIKQHNANTYAKIEAIEKEMEENWRLYEELVSKKRK